MGANVFGRLQTQRDSVRIFSQANGSPFELSPTMPDSKTARITLFAVSDVPTLEAKTRP